MASVRGRVAAAAAGVRGGAAHGSRGRVTIRAGIAALAIFPATGKTCASLGFFRFLDLLLDLFDGVIVGG